MLSLTAFIALAIVCSQSVLGADEVQVEEKVIVLTKSNFDEHIKNNQHVLVEFCKHFSYSPFILHYSEISIAV